MNWFKDNYGKSILLAIALLLSVSSALLILRAMSFREVFAHVESATPQGDKMPPLQVEPVEAALKALDTPPMWGRHEGSLFVSKPFILSGGSLLNPEKPGSPPLHPPVPNEWFRKVGLDILDPGILSADTDDDKFTNLQEWEYGTNPTNPKSTPPLYLLLRLKESRQVPNRIVFTSHTDNTFTINTVDIRQPTQFLEVGQPVKNTPFKLTKFEAKSEVRELGGSKLEVDVSELTLENTTTGETFVLVKERLTDLGVGFVVLKFLLDGSEIRLKRNQEFKLQPDAREAFKYIGLRDGKAVIQEIPTGKEILVSPEEQTTTPAPIETFSPGS